MQIARVFSTLTESTTYFSLYEWGVLFSPLWVSLQLYLLYSITCPDSRMVAMGLDRQRLLEVKLMFPEWLHELGWGLRQNSLAAVVRGEKVSDQTMMRNSRKHCKWLLSRRFWKRQPWLRKFLVPWKQELERRQYLSHREKKLAIGSDNKEYGSCNETGAQRKEKTGKMENGKSWESVHLWIPSVKLGKHGWDWGLGGFTAAY